METRSERLKKDLLDFETYLDTPVHTKWCAARTLEIEVFNQQIAYEAEDFNAVIRLRACRENTLIILNTFEEMRENFKTEIAKAIESENQLALNSTK